MDVLRLVAGCENFTFPNEEKFGNYRGRTVVISYSFFDEGPKITDTSNNNSTLEGVAREYVIGQLTSEIRGIPRY